MSNIQQPTQVIERIGSVANLGGPSRGRPRRDDGGLLKPRASGSRATQLLAALAAGTVITLFFLWVVGEGSAVPESPHSVPVAVVGPQIAVEHLAAGLEHDNAFHVLHTASEGVALSMVNDRQVDAVINLETHQLQTVPAASPLTAMALQQTFSSPQSSLHLQSVDIKPLTPGDPTGLGLMFISLACVLGGLPNGVVFALLARRRRPTSLADASGRVVLILASSGLLALFVALVADGVLGYGGNHMLTIWGWASLLVAASTLTVVALVAAIGLGGVLLAALPFLFFGVPTAPLPSPWNWQSSVFRVLAPYDPFGATTNGVRNGIFFGPASQLKNLVVMGGWVLVPVVLILVIGLVSQIAARSGSRGAAIPAAA